MNIDKVNFVNDLKSFVLSHNLNALARKLEQGHGKLHFKLNDQNVELVQDVDFHMPEQHKK